MRGGGFVKSCIDDGHFAVGLEGSDFSKTYRRAAWPIIPEFLFTCDISRPFQIVLDDGAGEQMLKFDVVTAWEFIEHIKEEGLPSVAQNVHSHLAPGGLFISSVANCEYVEGGARLHQTVRPETWWRRRFQSLGFEPLDEFTRYFAPQFVRGARWDNDLSFHFVLTNDRSRVPQVPTTSLVHRLYDTWLGSKPQRFLNKLIVGPS